MKTMGLVLSFLMVCSAWGADKMHFHNLGFSPDASHFAFANSIVKDGTGFPFARVSVIRIADDALVDSKSVTIEDGSSWQEKEALQRAQTAASLEKYNITPGRSLGEDEAVRQLHPQVLVFTSEKTAYTVNLRELTNGNVNDGSSIADTACGNKMMKVTLAAGGKTTVLHEDHIQPNSRFCSRNYKLVKVITQGKSLVVVVAYDSPGFNGDDTSYTVVSGVLP